MDITDLSGRYARQIEIQLARGDFGRAHAIVDEYAQVSQPQAELSLEEKRELAIPEVFDPRISNNLEHLGVFLVADLLRIAPERLLASDSFGPTSLEQIRSILTEMGFANELIQNDITPPPKARRRRRSN